MSIKRQSDWYGESPNLPSVVPATSEVEFETSLSSVYKDDADSYFSTTSSLIPSDISSSSSPNDDEYPPLISNFVTNCTFPTAQEMVDNYNIVTATICGLYVFFGIFCTLFGYRCFKAIMFLTGFIFGSIIVYLICLEENILPMWANTVIAVSAGLLFGLITLLVQYVGLFMLGFHGGLLLGLIGLVVADMSRRLIIVHNKNSADGALLGEDYTPLHSPWISVGTLLASGLVMSLCNLYFQKSLTIFNSALYGGAVVATGVDYFVENSIMLMWVWDKVRAKESEDNPCWFSWGILMIWPVLLIFGIIIQILVAGKGIYHEEQFPRVKRPRAKPETREERKQRKYRYLYQVRTCHGDVISQPIAKKYVHQIDETCA